MSAIGIKLKIKILLLPDDKSNENVSLTLTRITYPMSKMTQKSTRHQIYYKSESIRASRIKITPPH